MTAKVRAKTVLTVTFDGGDIGPDRVPLSSLSSALNAIHRLSAGVEHTKKAGETEVDPGPFQLMAVQRGSAIYKFGGHGEAPLAIERLRLVGATLERPEEAGDVDYMFRPLDDLSSIAARLHCQITIREPGRDEVLATILPDSFRRIRDVLIVEGMTSIAGTVKRVGGATAMRCGLRVPFQQNLLYCKVAGSVLSRKLGRYLYQDVVVHGKARWLKSSREIGVRTHLRRREIGVTARNRCQNSFTTVEKPVLTPISPQRPGNLSIDEDRRYVILVPFAADPFSPRRFPTLPG